MYYKQMMDSELLNTLEICKRFTKVENFNPYQNQILVECFNRGLVNPEGEN